jgi:SAM-dependent methyltransferase
VTEARASSAGPPCFEPISKFDRHTSARDFLDLSKSFKRAAIVERCNRLEGATADPERVLMESVRVLRPGGVLHMEMPNYPSCFEGYYLVLQPPIFWKPMLGWWVRLVFGRDPAFAATLQTQVNPVWCRRMAGKAARRYPLELVSVGEDFFLERLTQPFPFEAQMVASQLGKAIGVFRKLNVGNWMKAAVR